MMWFFNLHFSFGFPGTGNVLKIQSLLHTCSEFYKSKDKEGGEQAQEEGAGSTEATPINGKPGEVAASTPTSGGGSGGDDTSSKPAADKPTDTPSSSSDKPTASDKGGGKKASSSSKDVEMKDSEQQQQGGEPGSIGEPGSHQAICVLGIALIAMGEDIGAEMALRTFNHLVRFTAAHNLLYY